MPILEEISDAEDIDNLDMDLAEFDPSLKTPLAPRLEKQVVRSQDSEPPLFPQSLPGGGLERGNEDEEDDDFGLRFQNQKKFSDEELEQLKSLQLLYPCYFDKNRSINQGRRVPKELAVENPLAKTIADACSSLHLIVVFEPEKTHPQDWGNPGRVRVAIKHDGKPESVLVNNKRHLIRHVAKYLQDHPTSLSSLKGLPAPADFKNVDPQEIPRVKGFKMNSIVPMYSRFTLGHPFTKSIYEEKPAAIADKKTALPKAPKNKFLHVRR